MLCYCYIPLFACMLCGSSAFLLAVIGKQLFTAVYSVMGNFSVLKYNTYIVGLLEKNNILQFCDGKVSVLKYNSFIVGLLEKNKILQFCDWKLSVFKFNAFIVLTKNNLLLFILWCKLFNLKCSYFFFTKDNFV